MTNEISINFNSFNEKLNTIETYMDDKSMDYAMFQEYRADMMFYAYYDTKGKNMEEN